MTWLEFWLFGMPWEVAVIGTAILLAYWTFILIWGLFDR